MPSSSSFLPLRADTSVGMQVRDGIAPLLLRLVVGYGFMWHGYAKLARGPGSFAVLLHTLGVPLPEFLAWLTTGVELLGGFAILAGAFVSFVAVPMAIVLLTALFTVHLPYGFSSVKLAKVTETGITFGPVGYEVVLVYLAALGALAFGGAGPFSVDRWRRRGGVRAGAPERKWQTATR